MQQLKCLELNKYICKKHNEDTALHQP